MTLRHGLIRIWTVEKHNGAPEEMESSNGELRGLAPAFLRAVPGNQVRHSRHLCQEYLRPFRHQRWAVHWNIQLTNREGRVGQNSGVTVVSIERGKVFLVKDYIFDLGEDFRRNWSAP